jgi:hypothetical protein
MTYKIKPYNGHYILYINGKFYCTADNLKEVDEEIRNYVEERSAHHENKSAV